MSGSLTKALIGKEDLSIQTNTSATETFTRLSSTGGILTLEKFPDIWDGTGKINIAEITTGILTATYATMTGITTAANDRGDVYFRDASEVQRLVHGTAGQALTTGGHAADPAWAGMTTVGDVEYHNGTTRIRLAKGTAGQVYRMNAGATAPAWASGNITQVVNYQTGEVATGTTLIPCDDTIPTIVEGDEYMTLAITPLSATSKLLIHALCNLSHSANVAMTIALFQDATAAALASGFKYIATNEYGQLVLDHYMTSGTTAATTFRIRAGGDVGATTTFNGVGGARKYGGVLASSITIMEVCV